MTAENAFGSSEQEPMPWWLALIEGIALIIVGLLLLTRPGMTTIVLVQILGLYWIFAGILSIVKIFIDSSNWGWKLFAGIVGILAGIIIIGNPLLSTAILERTLIIILGFAGIFIGIMNIVQAFRGAGWGAGILGAVSILLGLILLGNIWLFSLSLPWTLGILSVIGGIVIIFGAFRLRSDEKAAEEALAAEATAAETVAEAEEEAAEAEEIAGEAEEVADGSEAVRAGAAAAVVAEALGEDTEEAEEETEEVTEEAEEVAAESEAVRAGAAAALVAEALGEDSEEAEEAAAEIPDTPGEKSKFHKALSYIEGIGPVYEKTLNEAGIMTPLDLLEQGATRKGRLEIAEKTQINFKLISTWVNHVDLYRVPGIGSQYADLLEEAGVDTVPELATRNAKNLHKKLGAVNEEKKLVRVLPALNQVEEWVAKAKELPRKVTF